MWKYASILILSILMSLSLQSQSLLSVSGVDKETYELYQNQEWKQLVFLGEQSIKQGVDFYYLRLRMGIAYYEMKNYRKSAVLFQKLCKQNPEDVLLKEYLYFSYLLGGRKMAAKCMESTLPKSIMMRYDIKKSKLISGIYVENKYEFIPDYSIDNDQVQEQIVRNEFHHFSVGLNHQLGKRIALFHAYSLVDLKNTNISDGITFNEELSQNQYYLKSTILLNENTELVLGGQWLQIKIEGYPFGVNEVENVQVQKLQLKGNGNGGNGNGDNGNGGNDNGNGNNGNGGNDNGEDGDTNQDDSSSEISIDINPYSISKNRFVGYLGLHKDLSKWRLNFGLLYYEIDELTRWQQEIFVRFYPMGNLNLYLQANFTNQMEERLENGWLNRRYYKGEFGIKLAKNTWGQVGYTYGNLYQFVENEGYSVFNGTNLVKNRGELSLYHYLFKGKMNLFILYQNQKEENIYILNDQLNSQHIKIHSITGGIKWNF